MGYNRTFKFVFEFPEDMTNDDKKRFFNDIINELENESEYMLDEDPESLSAELTDVSMCDDEAIDVLEKVSAQFPDVLFTVYSYGDMPEDLQVIYARNGKGYQADVKIEYPPPDYEKLG